MRKNNIRTRTSSKTTVRNVYAKGVLNNKVKSNRNTVAHPSSNGGMKSRLRTIFQGKARMKNKDHCQKYAC